MWRFSIFLKPPFADWQARLLARVQSDPRVILLDEEEVKWLIFCCDEEVARIERWRSEQGGEMSSTHCYLSFNDERIQVNREGTSESASVLAPYGYWILRELPVAKVVDDENGMEITGFALENPDALFGELEDNPNQSI